MSNFPLCKKSGLQVETITDVSECYFSTRHMIPASEVEEMLGKAQVVYGENQAGGMWTLDEAEPLDTHTARLVMIEEIKREPLKVEFETTVEHWKEDGSPTKAMIDLPDLTIKDLQRVRVTVEEIK